YFRAKAPRDSAEFYANPAIGEFWTGPRPSLEHVAAQLGIPTRDLADLDADVLEVDPEFASIVASDLAELRLVKDDWEVSELRAAIAATARGFDDIIAHLPEAIAAERGERVVEGTFDRRARIEGNETGYGTIAASGPHACYLHWTRNDG